jgi:hypothetical protein
MRTQEQQSRINEITFRTYKGGKKNTEYTPLKKVGCYFVNSQNTLNVV